MKYATFADFVREAYYSGIDAIAETDTADDATWDCVMQLIDNEMFNDAAELMAKHYKSVTIYGVVTFFPTQEEVKKAYGDKT